MGMAASCGYWKEKISDRNKRKFDVDAEKRLSSPVIEVKTVKKICEEALEKANSKQLKIFDVSYLKIRNMKRKNNNQIYATKNKNVENRIVPYQFSEQNLLELFQYLNEPLLLSTWQKIQNQGQVYYYNFKTKESVWEDDLNICATKITNLSVANHSIGDNMAKTICKFFLIPPSHFFNIVYLDLSNNKIGEKTMACISDILLITSPSMSLCQVEELKLSDNLIGDKGLSVLADKMMSLQQQHTKENMICSPLKALHIDRCKISNVGLTKFAQALASPPSKVFSGLKVLSLSGNRLISNEGVSSIVKHNLTKMLSELFLSGTKVSDDGAIAIAESLTDPNCTLITLSISGAAINDKGGMEIAKHLPNMNKNLRGFDLQGNLFSKEVRDKIISQGKSNKSCYVVVQDDRGRPKVSKR